MVHLWRLNPEASTNCRELTTEMLGVATVTKFSRLLHLEYLQVGFIQEVTELQE